MSHAEQLERETEQTRLQIADTLDELKESMTPAHVLHQLADRISDGAPAAFARNLKDQAVNNPLPVALISAGLAWLMLTPRNSNGSLVRGSGEGLQEAGDSAQQRAAEATGAARETAGSIASTTRQAASKTADAASDAAESMSESVHRTLSSGYGATADTARRTADTISESTKNAGRRTIQSRDALIDFCREQPMVVAGIGLAIGAMIGALLPTSEAEDRLMGEASDRAKESAQSLAKEKYEDAKNVGERAFDAAKDEAAKRADEKSEIDRTKADKGEHPTLVPSDEAGKSDEADKSELERRGYPWTDDNSPV